MEPSRHGGGLALLWRSDVNFEIMEWFEKLIHYCIMSVGLTTKWFLRGVYGSSCYVDINHL